MKNLIKLILSILILIVIFTFIPTGDTKENIIDGFNTTISFRNSGIPLKVDKIILNEAVKDVIVK